MSQSPADGRDPPEDRPLRVVMFHNRYTRPGGEDRSTEQEADLLRRHGHQVELVTVSNSEVLEAGTLATAGALWRSPFNRRSFRYAREVCRRFRPDVAHVQNFWFALSPSVHAACHAAGVATVQTLRNYRLLCVNGYLMRQGGPCEDCVGRAPWPGVLHACYRDSRLQSALVARMILHNRRRHTWERDVDRCIVLTEFARSRFVRGGLADDRLVVHPNFAADPGEPAPAGRGALFLGRLSPDKGIDLLLDAWAEIPEVPLTVAGEGPLEGDVERAAAAGSGVRAAGRLTPAEVQRALRDCAFLVMASRWYEGFPRVIVEAFAAGRAVLAPRLGAMAEVIDDGETGLLYEPGDPRGLAQRVRHLASDPAEAARLGAAARRRYLARYSPAAAYPSLVGVYHQALASLAARGAPGPHGVC